jgi:uncharacterized protein involved in outer membrane biogenesis
MREKPGDAPRQLMRQIANVTFTEWGGNSQPIIQADRIEADLSAFAALRGNVVFTRLKLLRHYYHI